MKGISHRIKLSKILWSWQVDTEFLLDGSAGHVLDLASVVPFKYQKSLFKDTSSLEKGLNLRTIFSNPASQLCAMSASSRTYIIQLYPTVNVLFRWLGPTLPENSNPANKLYINLDWTWAHAADFSQFENEVAVLLAGKLSSTVVHPLLARSWGKVVQVLGLNPRYTLSGPVANIPQNSSAIAFWFD